MEKKNYNFLSKPTARQKESWRVNGLIRSIKGMELQLEHCLEGPTTQRRSHTQGLKTRLQLRILRALIREDYQQTYPKQKNQSRRKENESRQLS